MTAEEIPTLARGDEVEFISHSRQAEDRRVLALVLFVREVPGGHEATVFDGRERAYIHPGSCGRFTVRRPRIGG